MNDDDIRAVLREELSNIAPEMDITALQGGADVREALDIDSMDFLNFIIAVHRRLGVAIPEPDYPKLLTLDGALAYLRGKLEGTSTADGAA
jgi:acyl carrier protein